MSYLYIHILKSYSVLTCLSNLNLSTIRMKNAVMKVWYLFLFRVLFEIIYSPNSMNIIYSEHITK